MSIDVVPYQIFKFWGFIYLTVVCLTTPVSTQTIYGRMVGRLLVWKACGRGSSCRLRAKKPRS